MSMKTFDVAGLTIPQKMLLFQAGIAPRPIAFVSTISADGINNLAPFSFFNIFGVNPVIVGFSPSRRGRDGTLKDTYNNLMATKECVIQVVTHALVHKSNLASKEFPASVDEFKETGLTPIASELVKPFRVKESPFQMECRLNQMIPLGNGPGSGNLALCEVLKLHVSEAVMSEGNAHQIDPHKLDLVARMGQDFYARASGAAVFAVKKP